MSLLLEMFSNIIQYQYVGNAHLVYAIVRRQEVRGGGGAAYCTRPVAASSVWPLRGKRRVTREGQIFQDIYDLAHPCSRCMR